MMTGTITDDQARALAQLVALMSGDKRWDIAGVRAAISKARHRAPAAELAIAAIRCATSTDARTPAVIAMDGPHWLAPDMTAPREHRRPKCEVHGVETRITDGLCPMCHADQKGGDGYEGQDWERDDPDRIEMNRMGARRARAAIRPTPTEEDQ